MTVGEPYCDGEILDTVLELSKQAAHTTSSSDRRHTLLPALHDPLICLGGNRYYSHPVYHVPEDQLKLCNRSVSPTG